MGKLRTPSSVSAEVSAELVDSDTSGARIANTARVFLRYDGEIGSGADNHTLNLGLRLSW